MLVLLERSAQQRLTYGGRRVVITCESVRLTIRHLRRSKTNKKQTPYTHNAARVPTLYKDPQRTSCVDEHREKIKGGWEETTRNLICHAAGGTCHGHQGKELL